jgi:hypothetical protein
MFLVGAYRIFAEQGLVKRDSQNLSTGDSDYEEGRDS